MAEVIKLGELRLHLFRIGFMVGMESQKGELKKIGLKDSDFLLRFFKIKNIFDFIFFTLYILSSIVAI